MIAFQSPAHILHATELPQNMTSQTRVLNEVAIQTASAVAPTGSFHLGRWLETDVRDLSKRALVGNRSVEFRSEAFKVGP